MSNENTNKNLLEIEIKRLYSSLNIGVFDNNEVTKKSIATYLRFLESFKVFSSEFEIIFGKYILIYESDILPQYFSTPQDTFEEDSKYLLFQIPDKDNEVSRKK